MEVTKVRDAAILTTSYVAWTTIEKARNGNVLVLHVDFTKWDLTSAQIKIDSSSSWETWDFYQRTSSSITSWADTVDFHEITIDTTWKYEIILPIYADYIIVSVKWTWTVSGSSMAIKALTGIA